MPFAEELKTSFEIKELQFKATQTLQSANTDKTFSRKKTFNEENFELKQRSNVRPDPAKKQKAPPKEDAKYDCFFDVELVGNPEELTFIGIVCSKYFFTDDCGNKVPGIAIVNKAKCKDIVEACVKSKAPENCWSSIVQSNSDALLFRLAGDFTAAATKLQPIKSADLGNKISVLVHPKMIEKLGEEVTVAITYGFSTD